MQQNSQAVTCSELPVPGGVYLCQVSERVSCAACCGLYNVTDVSYDNLVSMLHDRTLRFERVPREADAIADFGRRMLSQRSGRVPFPDFHHCPFVGFVGRELARAGCLLHPLAAGNNGVDYRGLSHYGGMACRIYFCRSHSQLSPAIKTIVRATAANWYEYGLVVTESDLLAAFFTHVEHRLGVPVDTEDFIRCESIRQLLRHFYRLKTAWPWRRKTDPGPCHYVFDDSLYTKAETGYPPTCAQPSPYDDIFRELGSGFDGDKDLKRAEDIVGGLIDNLVEQISSGKTRNIAC